MSATIKYERNKQSRKQRRVFETLHYNIYNVEQTSLATITIRLSLVTKTTLFDFNNRAFKAFVESLPVLCLAADRDFITTYVNLFYKNIHNITLDEAVGKHIKDIIGEEGFNDNLDYYRNTCGNYC